MLRYPVLVLLATLAIFSQLATAQFGHFFEQMFSGGSSGGGGGHGGDGNVASDSNWFRNNWEAANCNKYLCPATLSCVDKPTHCPCAFPAVEEKLELHPDGLALCTSKSGSVPGLAARKVELARKGLL